MGWCLEELKIHPHFISTEIKIVLFLVARAKSFGKVKRLPRETDIFTHEDLKYRIIGRLIFVNA